MREEWVPDALDMVEQERVCTRDNPTVRGWLWYCHEHDSHGNADSQEEAEVVAGGHEMYWDALADPDDEDDQCDVIVWQRVGHERIAGGGE